MGKAHQVEMHGSKSTVKENLESKYNRISKITCTSGNAMVREEQQDRIDMI